MSKLSKKIARNDFIRKGLCSNYWLWFHTLAAAIISKVLTYLVTPLENIGIMIILMVGFEIVEYFFEGHEPYGSMRNYVYDTLGDILFPLVIINFIVW